MIPGISRLAVLRNPTNSGSRFPLKETEAGAKQLGLRLQTLEARSGEELEGVFRLAKSERAGALIVIVDALFNAQQQRISDLAIKHRLPAMFDNAQYVEAGGLISYGANLSDLFRRAAIYVDKILKGAKPGDLPVEQPTQVRLGHQSEHRQADRPDDSAACAGAGGPRHSVTDDAEELTHEREVFAWILSTILLMITAAPETAQQLARIPRIGVFICSSLAVNPVLRARLR